MKQRGLIKKLSAVLLATVMTVSTFPQFSTSVYATDIANGNTENTYDTLSTNTLSTNETLNVEGGIEGKDYTYENGVIRLLKDGNYTIIGDGNVTTDRIIVEDNVNISLTLRNVNIRTQNTSCLEVKGTANVTLWLEGENSLRVNEHDPAALQFENVTTGSLIIDSKTNGKLVAYAWNGAAIGGDMWGAPKNLIIKGGIISATSGRSANAIGKGWYSSEDSDITIEGGIISTSSIMGLNNGLGGTENSKITIKGGYIDCGITGNAVVLGGYITGNVSGTVTNDNGIKLNKVNIPLMLDNVKEIWIDGVNQNINNTFTDALLQLYLTPGKHKIKIVDSNGNEKTYVININGKIDGNSFIELPKNLSITYNKNLKLSDIDLSNANWVWVDKNTVLSAGTKSYPASFDTTSLESTTDFSNVEGYDPNTHKVTKNVEVKVDKADSAVTITTQSLNKAYDGNAVSIPEYTTSGSDGKVTIKWQKNTGSADTPKWEDLKSAPSRVGTYRVVIELAGNDNYKPASATLDFTISKADNAWAEKLSIKGWKYNETANVPTAKAKYGDVVYTYSDSKDGTYTSEVPKNAGTYYVKATVAGTENYTGLESVVPFKIAKADTTLAFEKDNIDKIYDKNVISEPKVNKTGSSNDITFAWFVANGNDWTLLDNAPSDVGAYKVVVSAKEDTNYNGASIEKEFSISMADNEWTKELSIKDWTYGEKPSVPSATAKHGDVVYTYSDSKDGTYTSEVPKNAGTYYVKASVAGTTKYTGLESTPVSFEIKKADSSIKFKDGVAFDKVYDTNAIVVAEEHLEKTGSTGKVSFIFEKKVNDEWKNVETPTEVGTYRVTANLAGDDNYTSATSKPIEFTISKADSVVNITTRSLDKAYDGNAVRVPKYTTSGSDGKVTIKWQKNTGSADTPKWEDLKSAPSRVGTYRVVIELAGNDNYKPASATLDFTISKADNAWAEKLSIKGWKYNETANVPTAKAKYGDVVYTYSDSKDGTYTSEVPKNAGTYYVKATVAGTENYTGLESVVPFKIAKADTTLAFEKDNIDKIYDKNVISEPKVNKTGSSNDITFAWFVANGNDWTLLDNAPSDVGAYKVVVSAKEDTNYNGASIEKEFSISMADNEWTKELSIKDWTYGEKPSVPSATAKHGDVVYTYSDSKDGTYTSEVPKNAGTYYVKASVAGTTKYTGLESTPVSFEIKKADSSIKFKDGVAFDKVYDTNAIVVAEEHLEKTGSTGKVSFIFEKKVNDEWKNVETPTEVGTYRVTANLAGDDNYTSATSKPIEFTISKADSVVNITTRSLDKAYDGNAVRVPKYTTSGSDGKVTIKWQKNTGSADTPKWEDLKSAPSRVGTYRVVIELAGNDNYKPASATLDFTISKADNAWAEKLSIKGWKYNETANVPTAKAKYGDVVYTYSDSKDGTYTSEVPKNAGTYYVKASVAGTENYTGLESAPVAFEITKAIPSCEKVTGLVLGQGQALSKIELPEQFKWVDETMTADELGTHTFKAIYTPEDTANYQTIEVKVVPTPVAINHVPTINASDKTITVGDKFKPLKDVIANDKEDGDLTSKIKVIKNTVDTKKAGTYEVTYQVTDSQGATVTKTIKVTVKTAPVNPDKDKPNNDKGNVETRDQTNVGLFTTLSIISALGIAILAIWKKKR